jgi:hypothetical protein
LNGAILVISGVASIDFSLHGTAMAVISFLGAAVYFWIAVKNKRLSPTSNAILFWITAFVLLATSISALIRGHWQFGLFNLIPMLLNGYLATQARKSPQPGQLLIDQRGIFFARSYLRRVECLWSGVQSAKVEDGQLKIEGDRPAKINVKHLTDAEQHLLAGALLSRGTAG